jgi:3-isopropylmalate/(R)-2-methylmalate dehydratase small subunit
MIISGRVWKLGDDINTDVIYPGKYVYTIDEPKEMAKHALEGLDPDFAATVQKNDIIVGGKNFGCGSSREQAATCLKFADVGAVVAKSFARIFFRNAINMGLLLIQSTAAVDGIENKENIRIDFANGELTCRSGIYLFPAPPEFVLNILDDGGLIPHTRKKLKIGQKGRGYGF